MTWSPWQIATAAGGALAALWLFFRSSSASAATPSAGGGSCKDWTGDSKAIQTAINAALEGTGQAKITVDGKPGAMTCKRAEWLRDNKKATPEILAFLNTKVCGCGLKRAPCGISGPTAPQSVRDAIIAAGVAKGYPASDVAKAVSRESGWHAAALNCQGADKHPVAGGLLGFLASTAKANGFAGNIDQFAALSAEEQLPYCLSFIKKMPSSCLHLPGDFGLALFTPAYVCKPDSYVIYEVGSPEWVQNPGLREGGNGPITAGKVRSTAR